MPMDRQASATVKASLGVLSVCIVSFPQGHGRECPDVAGQETMQKFRWRKMTKIGDHFVMTSGLGYLDPRSAKSCKTFLISAAGSTGSGFAASDSISCIVIAASGGPYLAV